MRKIVLIGAAVAMMAGVASAQTATSSAPAKKPSFMSRMMTKATTKTTPTSSAMTRTTTTHVAAGPNAPIATTTAGGKPRTAQSIACSGQANAKGVHGKDREKFMRACKKGG
jgi:hypothetical protein